MVGWSAMTVLPFSLGDVRVPPRATLRPSGWPRTSAACVPGPVGGDWERSRTREEEGPS
ncbi:hypothetical protein GCM10018784_04700 [Streptomyces hydrogenans]|nr:hypothetical protein GCM10018784_04700 [Streptomyces hydrogenans]